MVAEIDLVEVCQLECVNFRQIPGMLSKACTAEDMSAFLQHFTWQQNMPSPSN